MDGMREGEREGEGERERRKRGERGRDREREWMEKVGIWHPSVIIDYCGFLNATGAAVVRRTGAGRDGRFVFLSPSVSSFNLISIISFGQGNVVDVGTARRRRNLFSQIGRQHPWNYIERHTDQIENAGIFFLT